MEYDANNRLVVAAKQGDQEAFAALVDQHYSMVHGLAFSKVQNWAVAEDLAQDAFLVAWKNLERLKAPEAFLVWLRTIARNSALNWLRRQDYRRKLADKRALEAKRPTIAPDDPAETAARSECLEHIGEALRSLSPKLREAMVLFYIEGQTAPECARALGISVDTMKKRLRLGRAKMHKYFQERSEADLEQLLPHKPKARIDAIVSGLAVGPALPEIGQSMAPSGLSMWIQDILHGASPWTLKEAAIPYFAPVFSTIKSTAATLVFGGLTIGAGSVLFLDWPSDDSKADAEAAIVSEAEPLAASAENSDLPAATTSYVLVDNLFQGNSGAPAGLQKGDRVIRVNGRPIAARVTEDPRGYLFGLPGTPVRVTVLRPQSDGSGYDELEFEIARPYLPDAR